MKNTCPFKLFSLELANVHLANKKWISKDLNTNSKIQNYGNNGASENVPPLMNKLARKHQNMDMLLEKKDNLISLIKLPFLPS